VSVATVAAIVVIAKGWPRRWGLRDERELPPR
jgi:hypothetical protein